MNDQRNNQGRAYEYVCLLKLEEEIKKRRPVQIVKNSSLVAAKHAWDSIEQSLQEVLTKSAEAATKTICTLELLMLEDGDDMLELLIQPDEKGEGGDVRDILIIRQNIKWEIGLSIKHNHFAVKHSRLARNLDFGAKWFGQECSKKYWKEIAPIFKYLEKEHAKGTKWSELPAKDRDVYLPLLNAFIEEIKRSYKKNPDIPKNMVEYLLGKYDFYKVISIDKERQTQIQALNLRGTLNRPTATEKSAISIPVSSLPSEIIKIRIKPESTNRVELYLDRGWQFSFRIHNASTIVEPSLKFDIQFEGLPTTIISINTLWGGDKE